MIPGLFRETMDRLNYSEAQFCRGEAVESSTITIMSNRTGETLTVSLCESCLHVREIISGTGSQFLLCQLSLADFRFPKYPPQPVAECSGHGAAAEIKRRRNE
jgi:hypothetical protein